MVHFQIIFQNKAQFDNSFDQYSWRKPDFSTEASPVTNSSDAACCFFYKLLLTSLKSNKF